MKVRPAVKARRRKILNLAGIAPWVAGVPDFYQRDKAAFLSATQQLEDAGEALRAAYARWEEIEKLGDARAAPGERR